MSTRMGNVTVEAKHYEQAIEEAYGPDFMPGYPVLDGIKQRARELAHAEQEKQE